MVFGSMVRSTSLIPTLKSLKKYPHKKQKSSYTKIKLIWLISRTFRNIFYHFFFFLYIKNIFILGVSLQSNLIRHWDVQSAFKDSQGILQHLRHSDRNWVFGENSESTRKFKARGKHLPSRVLGALY